MTEWHRISDRLYKAAEYGNAYELSIEEDSSWKLVITEGNKSKTYDLGIPYTSPKIEVTHGLYAITINVTGLQDLNVGYALECLPGAGGTVTTGMHSLWGIAPDASSSPPFGSQ